MRPLRSLILLLVLATALLVALVRPLPGHAGETVTTMAKKLSPKHRHRRQHHRVARHNNLGTRVVKYARRFVGVPYAWGGSSPSSGFDCSGFVRFVYQRFGISLPHSSYGDMGRGQAVLRRYLKPGDLVFFDGGGHVGIYVGSNRVIDSLHSGAVVHISTMSDWYSDSYSGGRRLLPT